MTDSLKYLLIIVFLNILLLFSFSYLYISDDLFYQSFGEKIAVDRILRMIEISNKLIWIGYVFISIIVPIRVGFTATCLYIGCFLANSQIQFRELFKVALLADFVFVLAGIAKLVILIFFKDVNKLEDLQFQPLSFLELFPKNTVDKLFIYPFSLLSVFELLYWLVLAWLLSGLLEKPFDNAMRRVASSYGTGLLLWVLFVMFLTVNLT